MHRPRKPKFGKGDLLLCQVDFTHHVWKNVKLVKGGKYKVVEVSESQVMVSDAGNPIAYWFPSLYFVRIQKAEKWK